MQNPKRRVDGAICLASLRPYYPLAEVSGDLQGMGNPKSKKGEPEGSPFETLEVEHKEEQI